MRIAQALTLSVVAVTVYACSDQSTPTTPTAPVTPSTAAASRDVGPVSQLETSAALPPIFSEPLTLRHRFTDKISAQLHIKPDGRRGQTVHIKDASNVAVVRFTIQPGVRFPWHTHPGSVIVSVTKGSLTFVYADDCVKRPYQTGEAFVDPGFGNIHYAFNPTGGETEIVATFLGVPATGPLTNPVDAATSDALDAKCAAPPAKSHDH